MKHILPFELFESLLLDSSKLFYHGTSKSEVGELILKDGIIKPGNVEDKAARALTKPIVNRVYCTPDPAYVQIYAMGGNMAGSQWDEWQESMVAKDGQFGYVFGIKPTSFRNPIPDEDFVGQLVAIMKMMRTTPIDPYLSTGYQKEQDIINSLSSSTQSAIMRTALDCVTSNEWHRILGGEYAYFARVGKKLLKHFKQNIIDSLVNTMQVAVATEGVTEFTEAWKFDKKNAPQLKKDGSNFFELCERVV